MTETTTRYTVLAGKFEPDGERNIKYISRQYDNYWDAVTDYLAVKDYPFAVIETMTIVKDEVIPTEEDIEYVRNMAKEGL